MYINFVASGSKPLVRLLVILWLIVHSNWSPFNWVPLELLQDSDSSSYTIAPHWSSSYPEYLSPDWDKNTQQAVVWTRLQELQHKLANWKPSKQTEWYPTLCQEFQKTQVKPSHKPSSRDISTPLLGVVWDSAFSSPCWSRPDEHIYPLKPHNFWSTWLVDWRSSWVLPPKLPPQVGWEVSPI